MLRPWLLCGLASIWTTATGEIDIDEFKSFEKPDLPAFLDYDCDLVGTKPGAVVDWNSVYQRVESSFSRLSPLKSNFSFPEEFKYLVADSGPHRSGNPSRRALEECPLGAMYLRLLYYYQGLTIHNLWHEEIEEEIQLVLATYPTYALALTRWPIFPVLAHFSHVHHIPLEVVLCDNVKGVVDWGQCRKDGMRWIDLVYTDEESKLPGHDETMVELQVVVSQYLYTILRWKENQLKASEECPFGFFFLAATQLVAAAGKSTQHLPPFGKIMDQVVGALQFGKVSSSPWPVWHVLAIFADFNKANWYWGGDRKYLRGYSDWNLRSDELSPLLSPRNAFLSAGWKAEAVEKVDSLVHLGHTKFVEALSARSRIHEDGWGPMRPIVRSLVDAAQAVAALSERQGLKRRLAYVVLLYGGNWAYLLERLARHLFHLKVLHPLLVIAIGEDAANTCRELMSGESMHSTHVICWMPDTMSQVHRFTCIHGLLHLGIDVLYTDMDTFWLRDPTSRILASAEGWDALFARHGDADCVNIGVFYLRASGRTALWMSQFIAWYHDHPFEIDQRGLHVFLGLPTQRMKVAFLPEDLVQIRGSVLEDRNEVVIGDIGWAGLLPRMLIFHWCHRPIELKEKEINIAYDAHEALLDHNLPVSLAVSVMAGAMPRTPWAYAFKFRVVLDQYIKKLSDEREACW
ncbi:unnamed protein product [Symbiodinium sp. CCMP2592]|nr:unnamed protein product [Symbiodinium sp. CCMP2592]